MVLLEKTLKHIQIQSALTPYVFPDPQALCEHLPVIWQLATGGQLLLIVPNIVVDILYSLRREDKQASADITFLEGELKPGKNPGVSCCVLLQGIFPTQGLDSLMSPALPGGLFYH